MPNRFDDDLSRLQESNLLQESDSAKHLLAYGTRALRTAAFIETTRDPVMTMLSIGLEKMLKIALGLLHVEDEKAWLPVRVLKNDYRHDLIKMERLLREKLREERSRATHVGYVDQALEKVDEDPVWPFLLAALNRYGQEGRFYYLDALAENPQREESPRSFWDAAERAAVENEEGLSILFHQMLEDYSLSDELAKSLNDRMADSLQHFKDLVMMSAVQGVLGARGKVWGHDIANVGRQVLGE